MSSLLAKAVKALKKTYHIEQFEDNALGISFQKDQSIFALLITEEDAPDTVFFSVAVDAPDPHSVADISLRLIHVCKTELAEPFYIDEDGQLHWSAEAYEKYGQGNPLPEAVESLLELESPGKLVN